MSGQVSGEVRLSEAEAEAALWVAVRNCARRGRASSVEARKALAEYAEAVRLAAVPVPSETGLAAAVEALTREACPRPSGHWSPEEKIGFSAGWSTAMVRLAALLSERTATTGGGGS